MNSKDRLKYYRMALSLESIESHYATLIAQHANSEFHATLYFINFDRELVAKDFGDQSTIAAYRGKGYVPVLAANYFEYTDLVITASIARTRKKELQRLRRLQGSTYIRPPKPTCK